VRGAWVAFRHVRADAPALWRTARGTPQPEGRWNRSGQLAQYLSLQSAGAWAELIRHEKIVTEAQIREWPQCLWQCWVTEHDIADLGEDDRVRASGLDRTVFYDGDYTRSQALADELRQENYRGLLSPNAALRGLVNLTLFDDRYESLLPADERGENYPNNDPDSWITVSRVAVPAYSPPEILPLVWRA